MDGFVIHGLAQNFESLFLRCILGELVQGKLYHFVDIHSLRAFETLDQFQRNSLGAYPQTTQSRFKPVLQPGHERLRFPNFIFSNTVTPPGSPSHLDQVSPLNRCIKNSVRVCGLLDTENALHFRLQYLPFSERGLHLDALDLHTLARRKRLSETTSLPLRVEPRASVHCLAISLHPIGGVTRGLPSGVSYDRPVLCPAERAMLGDGDRVLLILVCRNPVKPVESFLDGGKLRFSHGFPASGLCFAGASNPRGKFLEGIIARFNVLCRRYLLDGCRSDWCFGSIRKIFINRRFPDPSPGEFLHGDTAFGKEGGNASIIDPPTVNFFLMGSGEIIVCHGGSGIRTGSKAREIGGSLGLLLPSHRPVNPVV